MVTVNIRKTGFLRRMLHNKPGYEILQLYYKRQQASDCKFNINNWMGSLTAQNYPLHRVEIETVNRCDIDCPCCPARRSNNAKRPYAYMADDLYLKIMSELQEMNFAKALFLHCQNEAFMDKQIVGRAKIARELVPKSWIILYTNGNPVTPEKYHGIMQHLDFLFIDSYADGKTINAPIQKIIGEMTQEESDKTVIYTRIYDEKLDWIGDGNNRNKWQTLDLGCTNPFCEIYIQPTGMVPLCCKDVFCEMPMGDLNRNTISEVWNNENFNTARKVLLGYSRKGYPLCKKCDFIRKDPDEPMWLKTYGVEKIVKKSGGKK